MKIIIDLSGREEILYDEETIIEKVSDSLNCKKERISIIA